MVLVKYVFIALFMLMLYFSSNAIGSTNYMLVFSLLFIPVIYNKKLVDRQSTLLLLFSITYTLFTFFSRSIDIKDVVGYSLCPFVFYCFGRYVIKSFACRSDYIKCFFFLIVISTSAIFYYYSYLDYTYMGIVSISRRLVIEGTEVKNATYYGLVGSIGFAGISAFFYNLKLKKSIFEYGLFVAGILSALSIIHLLNRTGIVLILTTFILLILYKLSGKKSFSNSSFIFLFVLFIISYYFIQSIDSSNSNNIIYDAYSNRNDSLEGAGGRVWRWWLGVKNLFLYPLGWSTVQGYETLYAHNLWLDIARSGGVLPFLIFLIYTVRDIKNFVTVFRARIKNIIAYLLIAFSLVFCLSSFVEPIIDGFVLYFYLYCMIGGCLSQYCREQRIQSQPLYQNL